MKIYKLACIFLMTAWAASTQASLITEESYIYTNDVNGDIITISLMFSPLLDTSIEQTLDDSEFTYKINFLENGGFWDNEGHPFLHWESDLDIIIISGGVLSFEINDSWLKPNAHQISDINQFGLKLDTGGTNSSTIIYTEVGHPVPEPSTLAIFALGMFGLASRRFKKQS